MREPELSVDGHHHNLRDQRREGACGYWSRAACSPSSSRLSCSEMLASPTRSATVTPVDHTPPRWTGHRAAQAVWTLLIVLFAVLLVIALVDHTSILAIATPASSLVVTVNLLRFSLRARRAPGGGGTPS
jgi:hypothetical protein